MTGPPARAPLTLLNIAEMVSVPPPAVPWVAEPLLVRDYVTMLAGREGTGKSLLALALAAAAGNGQAVAGMEFAAPASVLYVDAENGEGEIHRRLHALGAVPTGLSYAMADAFDLGRHLDLLIAHVKRLQPSILVLDSLRSLAPSFDENDSASAEAVMAPLRRLAREFRCAVLVLHHAGKGDSSREYRGSSGLGAAIDCGFTLGREDRDPQKRTRRKLGCFKMRPAAEPPDRWVSLDVHDGRLYIAAAEPFEAVAEFEAGGETRRLADQIVAYVAANGPTRWQRICADGLGVDADHGTAKRARRSAVDDGRLARTGHGEYGLAGGSEENGPAAQPPKDGGRPACSGPTGRPTGHAGRLALAGVDELAPTSGFAAPDEDEGEDWS